LRPPGPWQCNRHRLRPPTHQTHPEMPRPSSPRFMADAPGSSENGGGGPPCPPSSCRHRGLHPPDDQPAKPLASPPRLIMFHLSLLDIVYAEGVANHSPGLPRLFRGYPGRMRTTLAAWGSQEKATPGYGTQHLRCSSATLRSIGTRQPIPSVACRNLGAGRLSIGTSKLAVTSASYGTRARLTDAIRVQKSHR
jgi:hypothetical protein